MSAKDLFGENRLDLVGTVFARDRGIGVAVIAPLEPS
jgi:hypothetical protein